MTGAWTQPEAINLCLFIEDVCPKFGCHVALTGGLLYKTGQRKDADILFYRIREVEEIDLAGLFRALAVLGIEVDPEHAGSSHEDDSWCVKANWHGKPIDFFFPETPSSCSESSSMEDIQL